MKHLTDLIHPGLASLDFNSPKTNVAIVAASFSFFLTVYILSSLIAWKTRTYRNLTMKQKIFWNLSIVRGVYGVFGTAVGVWTIWFDTELVKDVVFGATPSSYFALGVTVGFFTLECSALLVTDFIYRQQNILLNIHHWLTLLGCILVFYTGSGHYFSNVGLLVEMSTPFTATCWVLLKCDKANTMLWKVNQAILVHIFHCRTIIEGYMWLQTIRNWTYIWSSMPMSIFLSLYVQLTLIFFIMTPYWTYKKTAQLHEPVDWNFDESKKDTNGYTKSD